MSPVTSPVKLPSNAVDVIEVAPVTTPASILIAPSRIIVDPVAGVRFNAPDVAVIVLPSKFILSTVNDVNVPTLVIAVWAAPVTVAAEPLMSPVTLPVNGPTNPCEAVIFSLEVQPVEEFHKNSFCVVPCNIKPPPTILVSLLLLLANTIFLSFTVIISLLI